MKTKVEERAERGLTPMGQADLNVAVVIGRLTRPPSQRILPSGDGLVHYEVTIRRPGERADTVPVVWPGAPASALDHGAGDRVVVVGRVRRRFFRAGGTTASRTEIVAERVLAQRQRRRVRAAVAAAEARLGEALE